MKQIFIRTFFAVLVTLVLLSFAPQTSAQAESVAQQHVAQVSEQSEEKVIIFFYGQGCPHCSTVEKWFQQEGIYESYHIDSREVYFNRANAAFYNETMERLNVPVDQRGGVPLLVVGNTVIGGDTPIIRGFRDAADEYLGHTDDVIQVEQEADVSTSEVETTSSTLSIWMVVSASLVDAINPCAFAVLVILLTTVLSKRNRKKALLSGLAFTGSIFISYILMGLGVYAALGSIGAATTITKIVGVVAIVLGLLNLKNYFWYDKGGLIEVPQSWRPKMSKIIQSVTSPGGAFAIGFLVSLFLLPCTSGPYIVVLGLLAENPLDGVAMGYLLLYNFIFVTPMLLITLLVYKGLDPQKVEMMRQQNLERLHLVAGIILIAIGVFVLATS